MNGYSNPFAAPTVTGTSNAYASMQQLWSQISNASSYLTPLYGSCSNPGKAEKKVDVSKHHKLKSIILAIVVLYLIHKIWSNREKLLARAERIVHKTAAHLGLNDA